MYLGNIYWRHRKIKKLFILIFIGLIYVANLNTAQASYIQIQDIEGRRIKIPSNVEKVIPLGGALRFIVYLDAFDKVVGIENFEKRYKNNPLRPYSLKISEKVDRIPVIGEGGPGRIPDIEKIIALKPDLILAMNIDRPVIDAIEKKTNIPVVILSTGGRGVFEEKLVYQSLRLMGRIFKKERRAESLIRYMEYLKEDLSKRTGFNISKKSVYVGGISYGGRQGFTSTQAEFLPLKWIKANNLAQGIKTKGPIFLNREQILFWNPDVIFIDLAGLELIAEDYRKNPEYYHSLEAVKKENIYGILPFNNYHTNIELAFADAYYMGKILYPENFKDINILRKTDEIVYEFIGLREYSKSLGKNYGFGKIIFKRGSIYLS